MAKADNKKETSFNKVLPVIRVLLGTAAKKYPMFFVWESLKNLIFLLQPFLAIFISPLIVDEIVGERNLSKLITSYIIIPAATDAFRLLIFPYIGIFAT